MNFADLRFASGVAAFIFGGERGEVVRPDEDRGCGQHRVFVERVRVAVDVAVIEG